MQFFQPSTVKIQMGSDVQGVWYEFAVVIEFLQHLQGYFSCVPTHLQPGKIRPKVCSAPQLHCGLSDRLNLVSYLLSPSWPPWALLRTSQWNVLAQVLGFLDKAKMGHGHYDYVARFNRLDNLV